MYFGGRLHKLIAGAMAGATLLAACGSSSTSAHGATAASEGKSGGSTAKGSPLKVFAVTTPITAPDVERGLKMAEAAVNAKGGINGHPLDISICRDNQDPNTASSCVRNAISQGAVAELDRSSSYGASMNPVEQAENISVLGGGVYSEADFTASNLYPLGSGIMSDIGSAVAVVKALGVKKIGVPYVGVPAGAALAPTIKPLVTPLGASVVGVIPIAPTASDITPQVAAEVQAKPDMVIDGLTINAYTSLIKGMRQQGSDAKFLVSDGTADASQLAGIFGKNFNGIYLDAENSYTAPGYKEFEADFKKYNSGRGDSNGNVLWAWMSVQLLKTVAGKIGSGPITAKSISSTVKTINNYTVDGLIPAVNFTKPSTALGGKAPRLFNSTIYLYQYKDGDAVAVGDGKGVNSLG